MLDLFFRSIFIFICFAVQVKSQSPIVKFGKNVCKWVGEDSLSLVQIESIAASVEQNYLTQNSELACIYHQLAIKYQIFEQYDTSVEYFKRSIVIRKKIDDGMLWKSYNNIGSIYREFLNNYEFSVDYLLKAHKLSSSIPKDRLTKIRIYLCEDYAELKEFDKAVQFCDLALSEDLDKVLKADILDVYSSVLRISKNKEYIKQAIEKSKYAVAAYEKALHIYKYLDTARVDSTNRYIDKIIKSSINLGNAYFADEDFNEALNSYNEALSISIETQNLERKKTILNNIAAVQLKQKKYNESLENYNKSLQNLNKSLAIRKEQSANREYDFSYSIIYNNICENYIGLKQYDNALANIQLSIINLTTDFRDGDVFKNPDKTFDNYEMVTCLILKADVAYEIYKSKKNPDYLTLSEQTFDAASEFYIELLQNISTEKSRLLQAENLVTAVESALNVSYEQSKKNESYKNNAFKFMELNKATVLMQSITESDALQFSGIPNSLLQEEQTLKKSIMKFKNVFANKKLLDVEIEYDNLIKKLENKYPKYYDLKYNHGSVKIDDVKNSLDDSTAILEYFVGDSTIYVMTIQKNQVDYFQLEKPNNFTSLITNFRTSLIKESDNFIQNAHDLYEMFIKTPIGCLNDEITQLRIIPDAELNHIPFGILQTKLSDANNIDYKKLPYLMNEKLISYSSSSNFFLKSEIEKPTTTKSNYAVYAGDYSNSDFPEITCDLLTDSIPSMLNGQVYGDEACTIENFKKTANQNKIINFFLHGDTGRVVFTPSQYSADYTLDLNKLYSIDLNNVELAVLTACMTGFGPYQKGEGVMSVSRAFTYSGCSSLVMSLWYVPAKSTCKLIDQFLRELYQGKSKDEALRAAKKDYLKHCGNTYSHPKYWAGFVPSGNMSPIQFNK